MRSSNRHSKGAKEKDKELTSKSPTTPLQPTVAKGTPTKSALKLQLSSRSSTSIEVPPELAAYANKSPRSKAVPVGEAQLLKSPRFVEQQIEDQLEQWGQYEHAFRAGDINASMNDYELGVPLGSGRFGEVFRCRHRATGVDYALKRIARQHGHYDTPECIKQCLTERRILSSVVHPFICGFQAAFHDDDHIFFVLQLLPNGDLMSAIHASVSGLPRDRVVRHTGELSLALAYLHARHIIYRDLKPENVLIDAKNRAVLSDFGLSKIVANQKTHSICGTPHFLAPEMVAANRPLVGYGSAVDWWALGIVVHEMSSKSLPFDDPNFLVLMTKIGSDPVVYPPVLAAWPEATELLDGLLNKDPKQRLSGDEATKGEFQRKAFFRELDWKALEACEIERRGGKSAASVLAAAAVPASPPTPSKATPAAVPASPPTASKAVPAAGAAPETELARFCRLIGGNVTPFEAAQLAESDIPSGVAPADRAFLLAFVRKCQPTKPVAAAPKIVAPKAASSDSEQSDSE